MFCRFLLTLLLSCLVSAAWGDAIDLSDSVVRLDVRKGAQSPPIRNAARVLVEEVEKRTGLSWATSSKTDEQQGVILRLDLVLPAEGFRVEQDGQDLIIAGADARGLLYGAGWLLRQMELTPGKAMLEASLPVESSPAYPLRGHQLGYRNRANSWDAWTVAEFEQHIRELAIFGGNAIENIPFQDDSVSPHMKVSRDEMNVAMSQICADYGLEYWLWTPADFDLTDKTLRSAELEKHKKLYAACPRLDAVFFPGGDPGDNHPREVIPFIEDLAKLLKRTHRDAKIWVSLQGYDAEQCDHFYNWLAAETPDWYGGTVFGPGSPSLESTRARTPARYPVRHYPDITHTVRAQYEVKWWDPAYSVTLGRECVNPRPVYSAFIHNTFAPYTNGFLSYSDGVHDDVNKAVWSLRSWDPSMSERAILMEYARFFFPGSDASATADAILALEKNWEGPLAANGGVAATLSLWQKLEQGNPGLVDNWRWQMCLLRAYYDAHTRERLMYETGLEREAMQALGAVSDGTQVEAALAAALDTMNLADRELIDDAKHTKIVELCDALFESIDLQTSVERHQASGAERGCVLDFVGYPLNNRSWLADEASKITAEPDPAVRLAQIRRLAEWERNDPPLYFYDNVGATGQCPRVVRGELIDTDPIYERDPNPTMWWSNSGLSRDRLSWQQTLEFPMTLRYTGLLPGKGYEFRMTGFGEAFPKADGVAVEPTLYGTKNGALKVFPIPREATVDGTLTITFDKLDEDHLNWRQKSRIAEAWLVAVD